MGMSALRLWLRTFASLWCLSALHAAALPHERLDQLHHTAWTVGDGAPPEIRSMAQTPDGWLWLGSSAGVYRFDGLSFEKIDVTPPGVVRSPSATAMTVTPDGELWIGYHYGGASRWKDGRFTHYQQPEGLPTGPTVVHFELDGSGGLWALNTRGWYRFDGKRFNPPPPGLALPERFSMLLTDAHRVTWILAEDAVYRLLPGAQKFERTDISVNGTEFLGRGPDGSVWVVDDEAMRRLSEPGAPAHWKPVPFHPLPLIDRDWNNWRLDCDGVCLRRPVKPVTPADRHVAFEKKQVFGRAEGLTGPFTMSLLEDREGNLWVGNKRGLDRFRHARVVRVPTGDRLYFAMAPAKGRGIWLGTALDSYGEASPYQRTEGSTPVDLPGPKQLVFSQFRDKDGSVWVGGRNALWQQREGRLTPVPLPPGLPPGRLVQAISRDAQGGLWVALQGFGVYCWRDGVWTAKGGHAELPDASANVLVIGDDGGLWLGYSDSSVVHVRDGRVRRFGVDQGLTSGPVTAVHARDGLVIAAGALGAFVLSGDRFLPIRTVDRDVLRGVTGIVGDELGGLWLNGQAGLVRVALGEMQGKAPRGEALPFELLDAQDGLPGVAQQVRPLPSLLRADDGKLWIAATEGLAWLDPARRHRNPYAPQVRIRSLRSDAGVRADPRDVALPPSTGNIVIEFTALTLGHPERARFRYRMEGLDEKWQDAGNGREAHYTRLPAGKYRFHVMAANEDGIWNEAGAELQLQVQPTFYETWWFRLLAAGGAASMLWLAYRWRLRQQAVRLQLRMEARLQERERIARDLHDTLLQSTQGLILRFHGLAQQTEDEALRERMDLALSQADEVLAEGRRRVTRLRSVSPAVDKPLIERVTDVGGLASEQAGSAIHSRVCGAARALRPSVEEEVVAIGREALLNAMRHANASRIDLVLDYQDDGFRIQILDDGIGIDAAVAASGGRPGHWGLVGLRERAERVNGILKVGTRAGGGTEIELFVPAGLAFDDEEPPASWWKRSGGR